MKTLLALAGFLILATCVRAADKAALEKKPAQKSLQVKVRLLNPDGQTTSPITMEKVTKTDEEWRKQLTKEQYEIARAKGTERAFCGKFYDHKKPGIYTCVCCDLPLFNSDAKFDSGTGWPSFFAPIAKENIASHTDLSHGMRRVEILCARCDAHLGHVFDDGPAPTHLRYCMNSESLVFKEAKPQSANANTPPQSAQPGR